METYVSLPSGTGPFPAVVVNQHGRGVDQFVRDMADKLSDAGYFAVAPNLFHRYTEQMMAARTGRIQYLSDLEIVADVNSAVDFMLDHPAVDREHIGVIGFCMGGRVTWLAAATNPHFKAAVLYYGGDIMVTWGTGEHTPLGMTSRISCPVLFHFGELDKNPSGEDKQKLDAELTRLEIPHRFYTYPDADHAFMDRNGPRHNKRAFELSWFRTLDFFYAHLLRQD